MNTFGFWVYTGPQTGGCEGYAEAEYDALIDDMAGGGMNSLVICISCKRKGYRSRLPWLQHDQDPANVVIASDNEIVRYAIRRAHKAGIRVHVQACANCYALEGFDIPVPEGAWLPSYGAFKYDLDSPHIQDRAVEQCEEIVDLFPEADGLSVEFEGHNILYEHRIASYDAWAEEHDYPAYDQWADRRPNPRVYPCREFRAYTTWQTCTLLKRIEAAVRAKGFAGDMSTIAGSNGNTLGAYITEVDYPIVGQMLSDWIVIPYEYDRWKQRLSSADCCMVMPKAHGLTTHFLARGVMTWGHWCDDYPTIPIEEHWRADFEDALQYGVDGLWMFEADAFTDGPHADAAKLREKGFANGIEARRTLLALARECGVPDALG